MKKNVIIFIMLFLLVGCTRKEKNLFNPDDVLDKIEDTKTSTVQTIAYEFRQTVKLYFATSLMLNDEFNKTTFICNGEECSNGIDRLDLYYDIPSSGEIEIDENGEMSFSNIVINGYKCNIPDSGDIICSK